MQIKKEKKIILLFSLFLLLFIDSTILFDIIYRSHCIISTNFYLYLPFQQNKHYLNRLLDYKLYMVLNLS